MLGNMPVYDYNSSANPARPYADMGNIRELTSNEQAWYRAQTLEFHKFAGDSKLSWDVNYTHASSIDYETNTRSTSTTFLLDPNNPALTEGPSDNDIKHRIVANATYRLPWGFKVAAIAQWHSGFPYTGAISFSCRRLPGEQHQRPGTDESGCKLQPCVGQRQRQHHRHHPGQWHDEAAVLGVPRRTERAPADA